jgi:hypothetical protein
VRRFSFAFALGALIIWPTLRAIYLEGNGCYKSARTDKTGNHAASLFHAHSLLDSDSEPTAVRNIKRSFLAGISARPKTGVLEVANLCGLTVLSLRQNAVIVEVRVFRACRC